MVTSSLLVSLVFFILVSLSHAAVLPRESQPAGQSVTLNRRKSVVRTKDQWGTWARNHKEMLATKYGGESTSLHKRGSGTNLLTNQNADSSFFGSLAIGTPPVSYNVILDTGSSDLWVADSNCVSGCKKVQAFNSRQSKSFVNSSQSFSITYGSGEASGSLGQDSVQMAGFSVPNQVFAVCNVVSDGLLSKPVSGLLGLAFGSIASSRATPLWETLAKSGAWDEPVMTFQLTRFIDEDDADVLEPGGTFTMGFTNRSLYTGEIEYLPIPDGLKSYWILPMSEISVQGSKIPVQSGPDSFSAIDTGTTLVGGPAKYISAIFAQIPGSQPGTGDFDGYYIYPCNTTVTVGLSFGGKTWNISPLDFRLTQLTRTQCLGAFFELETGSSAPSWIVGDTFLKNVYSVFRYDPPSVGFATLSPVATSFETLQSVPTPTIGSFQTVEATAFSTRNGNGGDQTHQPLLSLTLVVGLGVLAVTFF